MIARLLEITPAGSVVLDPFMGSGTTGVACLTTGRKFIGVELDRTHFEASCRRIEAAGNQQDLFAANPEEQGV